MAQQSFQITVDGVPYMVKAIPFDFNGETRYNVSFNGSDDHIFAYDARLGRTAPIDDDAIEIPDNLEEAIASRLQRT